MYERDRSFSEIYRIDDKRQIPFIHFQIQAIQKEFSNLYEQVNDVRVQISKYCVEITGQHIPKMPSDPKKSFLKKVVKKLKEKFPGLDIEDYEVSDCHYVTNKELKKEKIIVKFTSRHDQSAFR